MAWIDIVDEQDAEGELSEVYEQIADRRGKVANIMRIHSLDPQAMLDHMELYTTLMFGRSGLRRSEREMIATVVSSANDCDYCVHHHAEALDAYWDDADRLETLADDWRALELSSRHRVMLEYAEQLTDDPSAVGDADVERMRECDLDDDEILQVNLVASYFNFVNRIAEGLGVDFDEAEMKGYEY